MSFKTLLAYQKGISEEKRLELQNKSKEIGKVLNCMMNIHINSDYKKQMKQSKSARVITKD